MCELLLLVVIFLVNYLKCFSYFRSQKTVGTDLYLFWFNFIVMPSNRFLWIEQTINDSIFQNTKTNSVSCHLFKNDRIALVQFFILLILCAQVKVFAALSLCLSPFTFTSCSQIIRFKPNSSKQYSFQLFRIVLNC